VDELFPLSCCYIACRKANQKQILFAVSGGRVVSRGGCWVHILRTWKRILYYEVDDLGEQMGAQSLLRRLLGASDSS
jgi:hypothetical protein